MNYIAEHEAELRLACFLAVLGLMAFAELWAPRRAATLPKAQRWKINLSLVALNTVLVRLVLPSSAVGVALLAAEKDIGLFNQIDLPLWLSGFLAIVLLDLIIYFQHVLFHSLPWLWRLHRVHHADLDLDVTTGTRFHPAEIFLSMLIKYAAILTLGAPVGAVLLFEIILSAMAMFTHSNIALPQALDERVRKIFVTPDMHRVHHSVVPEEANSNFGFNLSLWDRLLGTYRSQPAAGHDGMTIGLAQLRDPEALTLPRLLTLPVRGKSI